MIVYVIQIIISLIALILVFPAIYSEVVTYEILYSYVACTVIEIYCFVVLYSLFQKFRAENQGGNVLTVQYQAPSTVLSLLPQGNI